MANETLQWIRQPRQRRSQKTLERILQATEELIRERGVERVTVADVARRASSSVGSLYARFGDKESLVRSVYERFYEEVVATADHVFDAKRWQDRSLQDLIRSAALLMLQMFRERRQLIRGFTMQAGGSSELAALGERLGFEVVDRAHDFLVERKEPIAHPRPRDAVQFAVMMLLSALEARSLHTLDAVQALPDEVLAEEMTRMCLSYLGIPFDEQARTS